MAQEYNLDNINLLSSLDQDNRDKITALCKFCAFKKGEIIIKQGDTSRNVSFLVTGQVKVINYTVTYREVGVALLESGSYFGELSAIDGLPRSATVIATQDSRIATLPHKEFDALIQSNQSIALELLYNHSKTIRYLNEHLLDVSSIDAAHRTYKLLLHLAVSDEHLQTQPMLNPAPTQNDMAGLVSTTRETISRILSQLEKGGIIEKKDHIIYIIDIEKLKYLADKLDEHGTA